MNSGGRAAGSSPGPCSAGTCRSVFTEVGGDGRGGGAVAAAQPPSVAGGGVGAAASAGADREQAVARTAAQRALITAVSVAGSGLRGRERIR